MLRVLLSASIAILLCTGSVSLADDDIKPDASIKEEITVYTAAEPELIRSYTKEFNILFPNIHIKWVRDSAGPILARLIAEKEAPRADAIFALSAIALLSIEPLGILDSYTPEGAQYLLPTMKDTRENPVWIGVNAWSTALCINTRELEKKGLPMPDSFDDLLDPVYKGHIVMPNPVASSTAVMIITALSQNMGLEAMWEYLGNLDKNIKMYVPSGCKPCQMAAQGEVAIGIASDMCARSYTLRKTPFKLVVPDGKLGWDIEVTALVKGTSKKEAAQKVVEFSASKAVARIAIENGYIPVRIDAQTDEMKERQKKLMPQDFAKSAAQRSTLVQEWRSRFEANK